jgi:hypothetical protein
LLRSALLITYSSQPSASQLFPVDLATGTIPEGVKPVPINEASGFAFSTDHKTLVFASKAPAGCPRLCLTIIDLPTWGVRRFPMPLDDVSVEGFPAALLSSNTNRLAMSYSTITGGNGLLLVDLAAQPSFTRVDARIFVTKLGFSQDGQNLMLYGTGKGDGNGFNTPAEVALYSLSKKEISWQSTLPTVKTGQFHTDAQQSPELDAWFQPAVALSPHSDKLYIVHADEDKLTTIDFASHKVSTVDIHPPQSLLDRWMALFAGVAQAKEANGSIRNGVISPDGEKMYVVGTRMENVLQQNGDRQVIQTPLGLSVIDVTLGIEIDYLMTEASDLQLDPRGVQLYLSTWSEFQGNPITQTNVYDTQQRKVIFNNVQWNIYPYQLPVGKIVLLASQSQSNGGMQLTSLDNDTLLPARTITGWEGKDASWLIVP